jgi:UDP-N-acetylmuramoylalanine--D-glutamate ligase
MNLFWQHQRGTVIAVTGSNGKSTTTALIHSILAQRQKGRGPGQDAAAASSFSNVWLGGNIGRSLLSEVDRIQPGDLVILELSSFQLADLDRLRASPHVAVVTNFTPNHLDWHDTLDHYRWAKQTMLRWQTPFDVAVLNADDPDVRSWPVCGRRLYFGLTDHGEEGTFLRGDTAVWRWNGAEFLFSVRDRLQVPGRHNVANALAASAAALACGASLDDVCAGLQAYEPLPHRLQFVGEVQGRKFYNDSLATTPESAIVALDAFTQPVILLAGGYDKHVDLSELAQRIARKVKAVALMGQTATTLRRLIMERIEWDGERQAASGERHELVPASSPSPHARHLSPRAPRLDAVSLPLPDFEAAFRWAWDRSAPGDVILLSPGCASYDWFRNFADRGEQFIRLVHRQNLPVTTSPSE